MATKRHKSEEIVTKLRQVEVLVGQGMARIDAIRQIRIVEQRRSRPCSRPGIGLLEAFVEIVRSLDNFRQALQQVPHPNQNHTMAATKFAVHEIVLQRLSDFQ